MKTVNITVAGALIQSAKHRIPELARATLDRFANTRFKDLKLVTKAFRYQFPFYESTHRRRAFTKFFSVLEKTLLRTLPYLNTSKVKFINIEKESAESIYIRLGPMDSERDKAVLSRYIQRLQTKIARSSLPLHLQINTANYTVPKKSTNPYDNGYSSREEQNKNTYKILEIRVRFMHNVGEGGYLLLLYAPQILKILETLHRKAHYADTTYKPH
jgi:hypothetical protein